jgi:alpha-N-arabinofuranosidase
VGDIQDARIVSQESAGGQGGAYIGMFGSSNGVSSDSFADFDWFAVEPLPESQGYAVE